MLLALVLAFCMTCPLEAQLKVGFYKTTCPRAKDIVREKVTKAFRSDNGITTDFVRMHFHNYFVRVSVPPINMILVGRTLPSITLALKDSTSSKMPKPGLRSPARALSRAPILSPSRPETVPDWYIPRPKNFWIELI